MTPKSYSLNLNPTFMLITTVTSLESICDQGTAILRANSTLELTFIRETGC